jgi:hypothetical protein
MAAVRPRFATLLTIAILVALLVGAIWMSLAMWNSGEPVDIGWAGIGALVLGSLGTLVLGGGLMALVFYSARSGHDEAAHLEATRRLDSPPDA